MLGAADGLGQQVTLPFRMWRRTVPEAVFGEDWQIFRTRTGNDFDGAVRAYVGVQLAQINRDEIRYALAEP
jgi:hypothetical protein